MLSRRELGDLIRPLVEAEGLQLYDVDTPTVRSRLLRVYIWSGKAGGVTADDCARVSKAIEAAPQVEEALPNNSTLEVSTPGLNRRLRDPSHYQSAVGENVKVQYLTDGGAAKRTTKGQLGAINGDVISLVEDGSGATVEVALPDVVEARLDFVFGRGKNVI